MRLISRHLRRLVIGTMSCGVLAGAARLAAHDFWLIPDAFAVARGGTIEVRGQTSSRFPTSESAVATDRVAEAVLAGGATRTPITALGRRGTSLLLSARPGREGQYVVAVRLHPRSSRETAAGFRRYLELEGAPDALARVDREGLLTGRDSVTRRYAKYAKTLLRVGRGGTTAFATRIGHPLEFVPRTDPLAARAGDTLTFTLLYRGAPVAGVRVHAEHVPASMAPDAARDTTPRPARAAAPVGSGGASAPGARTGDAGVAEQTTLQTDARGDVRVPVGAPGLWNVRTLHIVQAGRGTGADWDAHWATLVFQVRP